MFVARQMRIVVSSEAASGQKEVKRYGISNNGEGESAR